MDCEIINIGSELLNGDTLNTNSRYISKELESIGISILYQSTIGNTTRAITDSLNNALLRSELIFITGGMGDAPDDITKETVCDIMGVKMFYHTPTMNRINSYYRSHNRIVPKAAKTLAMCPNGAVIFRNDIGIAPGYSIEAETRTVIMLPATPKELDIMFSKYVLVYLAKKSNKNIKKSIVRTIGLIEEQVFDLIKEYTFEVNPFVTTAAHGAQVDVIITSTSKNKEQAIVNCDNVTSNIKSVLGKYVFGEGTETLQAVVVGKLKRQGLKIATAESCTAGLISATITDVPGSSSVFEMGVSAYSEDVKEKMLGVKKETIKDYTVVSAEVAAEMAVGIIKNSGADIGISVTGEAGPVSSGAAPVGTVYIGFFNNEKIWTFKLVCSNEMNRDGIRHWTVSAALDILRRYLNTDPSKLEGGFLPGETVTVANAFGDTKAVPAQSKTEKKSVPIKSFSDDELIDMMNSIDTANDDENPEVDFMSDPEKEREEFFVVPDFNADDNPETDFMDEETHVDKVELMTEFTPDTVDEQIVISRFKRFLAFLFPSRINTVKSNFIKSIIWLIIIATVAFGVVWFKFPSLIGKGVKDTDSSVSIIAGEHDTESALSNLG